MKKSDVLKQQRAALEAEVKPLLEMADLSDDQKRLFDEKTVEIENLNIEIKREEKREAMIAASGGKSGVSLSQKEDRDLGSFSFVKFMRESTEGQLTGLEAEMHQEGKRELLSEVNQSAKGSCIPRMVLSRASTGQNITTAGDGGNLTQVSPVMYVEALKNALIIPAMGANYLTGLVGNLPIVRGGLFSATWAAEGTAVDAAKAALTKITMAAKRLTATGAFSQELLRQGSIDVENWIRQGLIDANALAILTAVINGSSPAPTGILGTASIGSVAGGADGLAPAWSHIVDLESAVANANADLGKLGYLTNSKVRGKLKQTLKAADVAGYIWDGEGMNGYKCGVTNAVPSTLTKGAGAGVGVCSAIIFGNWADLMIGEWGGLDIVVDPYTLKKQGDVEITVHTFADIAVGHPASFAAMKDALTA
jgi:HK97 family phage major capsid protein